MKTRRTRCGIGLLGCIGLMVFHTASAQEWHQGLRSAGLSYTLEQTDQLFSQDWHLLSVEASVGIPLSTWKWTALPRLNIGQRTGAELRMFDHTGLQFQCENYFSLPHKWALSLHYAFSDSRFFAKHQATAELTVPLGAGWALNPGVRFTHWQQTVMGYSLGVEKYVGSFWLTFRPSLVVQDQHSFWAVQTGVRYYIKEPDSHFSLNLYYGNTPEYANYLPDFPTLLTLRSWGTALVWSQPLFGKLALRLGLNYRREEFRASDWRTVWGIHSGLTYHF